MPRAGRLRLSRRGFTLMEVVVVTVLVSVLTTASLVWFSSSASPDADAAAKSSLLAVAELQRSALAEGGAFVDAAQLAARDPARSYSAAASESASNVSVLVSGPVASAAVRGDGGTCWAVRLDAAPSAPFGPAVFYVGPAESCTAPDPASFSAPPPGSGATPADPAAL